MKRTTLISYIMFLYIGLTINLIGVTIIEMANMFEVNTYIIGYRYTLFYVGMTITMLLNGFLLKRVNLKYELLITFILTAIGVFGLSNAPNLNLFAASAFIFGAGVGLINSSASYMIIHLYSDPGIRTSRLNFLNFFYGLGAVIAPIISSNLAKAEINWKWNYIASAILLLILLILTSMTPVRLSHTGKEEKKRDNRWNWRILIIGLTLTFYTLSELIYSQWIVEYLKNYLNFKINIAGLVLSLFWLFIAIGRFLSGFVIKYLKLATFLTILSALAVIGFVTLFMVRNPAPIIAITVVMGLCFSALYASIISYGTLQLKSSSAPLMSFILTMGSAGVVISSPLSSLIKQLFSIREALMLSMLFMALVCIMLLLSRLKLWDSKIVK